MIRGRTLVKEEFPLNPPLRGMVFLTVNTVGFAEGRSGATILLVNSNFILIYFTKQIF
jgi:hypothetical protein